MTKNGSGEAEETSQKRLNLGKKKEPRRRTFGTFPILIWQNKRYIHSCHLLPLLCKTKLQIVRLSYLLKKEVTGRQQDKTLIKP